MSGGIDGRRGMYRLAVVAAVCPIVVSAVRNGLADWAPTSDAAIVAVRTRDVFSAHPPLYGLAASSSVGSGSLYSYTSGWMFYLLAVPVHLLGTKWGLLVGMAAINGAACVAALWLIRRRAGEMAAILACAFVATLLWTIGSQAMVDPSELSSDLLMVFAFLVAAWCVADDDALALPVLALSGNYLLLTVLRYGVLVPAVVAWSLVVCSVRWYRTRDRAGRHEQRRSQLRWLAVSVVATVIMWVPPLVDQVAGTHNLGKLAGAAFGGGFDHRQAVQAAPTLSGAAGVITSITAAPSWWLPPSYAHPPFDPVGGGASFVWRFGWSMVLLGSFVGALVLSWRRRDRTALVALGTSFVGWIALYLTLMQNPSPFGFGVVWYFNALWPLAAFVWFTIVFAFVRGLPRVRDALRVRDRSVVLAGCAVTLVFTALALPYRNAYTTAFNIPQNRQIRAAAAEAFHGDGPVLVEAPDLGGTLQFRAPVMLGLQDAGVQIRVPPGWATQQFGSFRSSTRHDAVVKAVVSRSPTPPPGGRLVGVARGSKSTGLEPVYLYAVPLRTAR